MFVHEKNVWCVSAGGHIGTSSREAVFYVGASSGFGMERLDVEDHGDNVQLQPEAGAKVRCLDNVSSRRGSERGEIDEMYLRQEGHGDSSTEEFTEMLR